MVAVMLTAGRAEALDPWTADDTKRELLLASLAVAEMGMTSVAFERHPDFYEMNPALGRHPSHARLWLLGTGAVVSHFAISRVLPRTARSIWQAAGIAVEVVVTTSNATVLLSTSF